jgi:ferredoxin
MRALVDRGACTGCGLCPDICPDVFELDDSGKAFAKTNPIPADAEESAEEAAQSCPVNAITVH